jgi:hypothetical protein
MEGVTLTVILSGAKDRLQWRTPLYCRVESPNVSSFQEMGGHTNMRPILRSAQDDENSGGITP